ncbi:MAG: signal peptidase I [Clostridia bacterium]|nr:signal peptidase I [Clostridia bacterium]
MKQSPKRKFSLKSALRFLLIILCGIILGVNVYLANANSLVGNKLPTPFGYGAAVVLSGSMEPELSKGDLIIVRETEDYSLRDVVVFQDADSLVVHRIVDMDEDTVTTKGDANGAADEPVKTSSLKGKVVFSLPAVGSAVSFLKTPIGIILVLAAAIALLEIPRRREKQKDDEEKQKIIEEIERLKNGKDS